MAEKLYTIPINEAFDNAISGETYDCPFCLLQDMLEKNELEIVLGDSKMEPAIRIETNKKGFCKHHFDKLYEKGYRLGLALILESHIAEVEKKIFEGGTLLDGKGEKEQKKLETLESTCFICDRMNQNFARMMDNMVYLWKTEEDFREKFKNQQYFCLPHYKQMIEYGRAGLDKKDFAQYFKTARDIEKKYISELGNDVSWFCKKFEYQHEADPWYNAKDSVPRALSFLSGGKNTK